MNVDSNGQAQVSAIANAKSVNIVDGGVLGNKKIKRERTDVYSDNGGTSDSGGPQQNRISSYNDASSPCTANGPHAGELVKDILAGKMTTLTHSPAEKHCKIRQMLEDAVSSSDSKCRVQGIFLQVEQLRLEEKLLLYLKLPLALGKSGENVDPLRQPLNPLGNRYEIHQTIMWIKTHLEEDPDVSLPKQEVYDEYNMFCIKNCMKPLSTADFGKVMKQVYPRVRPRRLGTRGNSRYCYAGMRKKIKLDPPSLPPVTGEQPSEEEDDVTEEMLGAASALIREWAESMLGLKFLSLSALARHLVTNFCVDTRSLAAVCILCATTEPQSTMNNKATNMVSPTMMSSEKSGKLKEVHLQLQRKLQQREHSREQKHRHHDAISQNQNKVKTVNIKGGAGGGGEGGGGGCREGGTGGGGAATATATAAAAAVGGGISGKGGKKNKLNQSPQDTDKLAVREVGAKSDSPVVLTGRQKIIPRANDSSCTSVSLKLNCDNIVVRSNEDTSLDKDATGSSTSATAISLKDLKIRNPRKRANLNEHSSQTESVLEKQQKLLNYVATNAKTATNVQLPRLTSIQRPGRKSVKCSANAIKSKKCKVMDASSGRPGKNCDTSAYNRLDNGVKENGCPGTASATTGLEMVDKQTRRPDENAKNSTMRDKICTLDPDAFDDYLNGGNNSQEQEEELLQYFQQSSSSSSDVEANATSTDADHVSRSDKVSQLRLILQQNLTGSTVHPLAEIAVPNPSPGNESTAETNDVLSKPNVILSSLLNYSSQSSTRRRVSFETNVVERFHDHSNQVTVIPQSPNTRRRIFNFTPISPGPVSPINGGRVSKPGSANGSPFVSPRNTPVPRSRSNVQAIVSRSRASQKPISRSMSCSVPYTSRIDTFVVPTEVTRYASAPQSPPCNVSSKTSDQAPSSSNSARFGANSIASADQSGDQETRFSNILPVDLTPQKQLLINYPSQENLQEIKPAYRSNKPPDQEISELFPDDKHFTGEQFYYRSQSVPLHRMVNPTLMSPLSAQQYPVSFQNDSFNPSTSSSVAPTPVPSEFNDFGPISHMDNRAYLLNDADNVISPDDGFMIGDKGISSENLTNIFKILDSQGPQSLHVGQPDNRDASVEPIEQIGTDNLILNSLQSTHLNIATDDILDPITVLANCPTDGGTLQRSMHSRSYPNTPLPKTIAYGSASAYTEQTIGGSKSYPSTPRHPDETKDGYSSETTEPMLSSLNLDSLQLPGETVNSSCSASRNVTDLLETGFLADAEGETDNLDPLSNFDTLEDVGSFTPLFNEVSEVNH